jgi:hypothetical protein
MPKWSNEVPESPRGPALPIRRTPSSRPLEAIVTSEDLIGCYTHFYQGSTTPCEGEGCEACLNGMPYRWHAYITAVDSQNNLHFIFEVTALGAEYFTAYRDVHNTLRGCHFQAKRWNNRPNGRILIQCKPCDLAQTNIPAPPDLKKCMAILWSLPAGEITDGGINPETQTRVARRGPNGDPKP